VTEGGGVYRPRKTSFKYIFATRRAESSVLWSLSTSMTRLSRTAFIFWVTSSRSPSISPGLIAAEILSLARNRKFALRNSFRDGLSCVGILRVIHVDQARPLSYFRCCEKSLKSQSYVPTTTPDHSRLKYSAVLHGEYLRLLHTGTRANIPEVWHPDSSGPSCIALLHVVVIETSAQAGGQALEWGITPLQHGSRAHVRGF
jgi:hypothetical protein